MPTRMAKATLTTITFIKIVDDFKTDLPHRHKHDLRDALTEVNGECFVAVISAGTAYVSLII